MKKSKDLKITKPKLKTVDNSHKLFYGGLVLVIVAMGLLITALGIEQRSKRSITKNIQTQTPFHLGQTINLGEVSMSIEDATYSDGQTPFTAPNGKHYAVFYMTVRNLGEKPVNIFPSTDTYIKDLKGNIIYLTPFIVADPFRAGELSPGETIRGQLSFLVPKDGNFKFYIDAIWSGGVVPFSLD